MWSTGGKMAAVAENHGAVSQQFSQYCPGGSRVVFGSGNLRYSGGADSAGKPPAGRSRFQQSPHAPGCGGSRRSGSQPIGFTVSDLARKVSAIAGPELEAYNSRR